MQDNAVSKHRIGLSLTTSRPVSRSVSKAARCGWRNATFCFPTSTVAAATASTLKPSKKGPRPARVRSLPCHQTDVPPPRKTSTGYWGVEEIMP